MKQKKTGLSEGAWISRLWAQYSQLPEAYKQGFFNIARSLAEGEKMKREKGNKYTLQGETLTLESDGDTTVITKQK
jgi:hypothetical protein